MILFSILIPAYNVEKYISECLYSVIFQSGFKEADFYEMVEILVADDGSTDCTGDICDRFERCYKNIHVFHKKNEGHSLTREFLVSKAQGKYVLFLDSDDKWEDNLLKRIIFFIRKYHNPDMISFEFNVWKKGNKIPCHFIGNQEKYINLKEKYGWEKILCSDNFNSLCTKVIKRSVLQESKIARNLIHVRRGEDKLLTIACMEHAENWLWIPEVFYDYRIDDLSVTRSFQPDYFDEILQVEEYIYKKMQQHCLKKSNYCDWASSLLLKWNDYIFALDNSELSKDEIQKYQKKYGEATLLKRALYYGRKHINIKCCLRAWLLSLKGYKFLNLYHRKEKEEGKKMLLSVLIPAYNVEEYLAECLNSVIFQTGIKETDFQSMIEIVVADDGSTDNTGLICDQYAEKYKNIQVFHKENEGLSLTREFLAAHANGEYVIFLDADDRWQENLLEKVLPLINKYDFPDMISFGFNIWENGKKKPCYAIKRQEIYFDLMKEKVGGGGN